MLLYVVFSVVVVVAAADADARSGATGAAFLLVSSANDDDEDEWKLQKRKGLCHFCCRYRAKQTKASALGFGLVCVCNKGGQD